MRFFAADHILKTRFADGTGDFVRRQKFLEPFCLRLLVARNSNPLPDVKPAAQGSCQRHQRMAALLRHTHPQVTVILTGEGNSRASLRGIQKQAGELDDAASGDDAGQFRIGQKQLTSRRVGQTGSGRLGDSPLDLLAESETGVIDRLRVEQDQRRCRRNVVENGFKSGMEKRLQKIYPLEVDRILQIFQNQTAAIGRDIQIIADLFQARPDLLQQFVREQQFPRREQHQLLDRLQGSLRQRIKGAYGLGGISKKLDPDRRRQVGGEDIEDSAPHRKGAAILHQRHIGVPHPDQPGQQFVPIKLFAGQQIAGSVVQGFAGEHPLQRRRHRHDGYPGQAVLQAEQRIEPGTGHVRVRGRR